MPSKLPPLPLMPLLPLLKIAAIVSDASFAYLILEFAMPNAIYGVNCYVF